MSKQYPGGVISKTPPTPSGAYQNSTAPGVWTLEQQAYWQKLGQWPTQGNVDPSAFIENLFSTYLYTGNGTSQSIVNGIDVSTYGGMTWIKNRSTDTGLSVVHDTARGTTQRLSTNLTDAQVNLTGGIGLTAFNSNGFTVGTGTAYNGSGNNLASWTFRKQPKFFDVVTYTGNGTNGRTVAHSLGSTPGCIIVKRTDASNGWAVYHRSMNASPQDYMMRLNATDAAFTTSPSRWNNTLPTSTEFTLSGNDEVNGSGATYVAYLFAHNAGGFGLTGTDNVISCGSYTGTGSVPNNITLGFEPQWLLVKSATYAGQEWGMFDNMRGLVTGSGGDAYLYANSSGAEGSGTYLAATATGFSCEDASARYNNSGDTYIYIAIRRGPMAVPTLGTSVFDIDIAGNATAPAFTSAFPVDFNFIKDRLAADTWYTSSRLTGSYWLEFNTTAAQQADALIKYDYQNGTWSATSLSNYTGWNLRRAPSFFDVVCYTGTATARTVTHNLGVAPELLIVKMRSDLGNWRTYAASQGNTKQAVINATDQFDAAGVMWNSTTPTASVFSLGNDSEVNGSGQTYVAYLFATCAGVSKVGSYTGTGATQTINCGFTGGARFVLIKRADSTGDWYIWDTTRGMVSGTDPSLKLNTTAAQVNANSIYTTTGGFQIVSTAAGINASGGTYIFLAIA